MTRSLLFGVFLLSTSSGWASPADVRELLDRLESSLGASFLNPQYTETNVGTFGIRPVGRLPGDIAYDKEALSLTVLPGTSGGVVLVNDTDSAVKGIVDFWPLICIEAKIDGRWRRLSLPMRLVCGLTSPPSDLPARSAWIIDTELFGKGDTEGEVRFYFQHPSVGGVLVSPVVRRKFLASDIERAKRKQYTYDEVGLAIEAGLSCGEWWKAGSIRNPEEVAAAFELARFFDQSWLARDAATKWLEASGNRTDPATDAGRCAVRLKEILAAEWKEEMNLGALFQRCLAALDTQREGFAKPYGSPENCRAVVWNRLRESFSANIGLTSDQIRERNAFETSRNPWKANADQSAIIVREALVSLRGEDLAERTAALWAISKFPDLLGNIPTEELLKFLGKPAEPLTRATVGVLVAKGERQRVVDWLVANPSLSGQAAIEIWGNTLVGKAVPGDGDLLFFKRLITQSLRVSQALVACQREWKGVPPAWAEEYRQILRTALDQEMTRLERQERSESEGGLPPATQGKDAAVNLETALTVLDAWNRPEDTALIQRFLGHSAGMITVGSPGREKFYPVREHAFELLLKRVVLGLR